VFYFWLKCIGLVGIDEGETCPAGSDRGFEFIASASALS